MGNFLRIGTVRRWEISSNDVLIDIFQHTILQLKRPDDFINWKREFIFGFHRKKQQQRFHFFFHKLVWFYREMFPVSFECYATFGRSFNAAAVFLESKKEKNPIVKLKVQQHACMNNNGNYERTARSLCGSYEMCNYVKILIAHANWWNVKAKKSVYESSTILTTVRP